VRAGVRLETLVFVALAAAAPVAAQPKTPAKPPEGWKVAPFSIANPAQDFRLALRGYLQADFRSYKDWQVGDGTDDTQRADEFEWQRLRVGLEGEWRRLSFELDVDPAFDKGDQLKDAWLGLRIDKAFQVRGGNIKVPVSREWLISPAKIDLIEREDVVDGLAPSRDWGGVLEGEIGKVLEYQAGVFDGDGRALANRAGTTIAGRLLLKPRRWLDVGGSYSQGDVAAAASGPGLDPEPKSLHGESATGYEFFPAVFVNGRRLRWSTEARLASGPVALWGEFLESREERKGQGPTGEDLPELRGDGWSVTATWLVTGEKKTRTIRPRRALFGGPGAVELSARYEEMSFDDVSNAGFESAGSRAGNVRPAGIKAWSGGLSWWPTIFLRFMANVIVERYDDPLRAPEPGKTGDYVSFFGRIQVHLP
jgi:phosphate-selective porin OprO/OprP